MKSLYEYIVKESSNESLNLKELYNYIKDNYTSKSMDRLKIYDNSELMIPVFYKNQTTEVACFSVTQGWQDYIELSKILRQKLDTYDSEKYESLMKNIEETTKKREISNKFVVSVLNKIIDILGKDSSINRK